MNIYLVLAMAASIGFQQAPFLPVLGGIGTAAGAYVLAHDSQGSKVATEQAEEIAPEAPKALETASLAAVAMASPKRKEPTPKAPGEVLEVELSAYTSTPEETDDTPFITASGSRTRPGVVASNILPFGTKIQIPDHFGDQIFTVEDRMNVRYQNNVDVWVEEKSTALKIGRVTTKIVVLE